MVFVPEEHVKAKMEKDGSVLKYMLSVAGGGLGLQAAGWVLLGAGILLGVALFASVGGMQAAVVGGIFGAPGLLMVVIGIVLQKRRLENYVKLVEKRSGLAEEDIHAAEAEFKQPGTMLLSLEKPKGSNALKKCGFLTEHYLKLPGIYPYLYRLDDLVACFYTKKYLCEDGGYNKVLVVYGTDPKNGYELNCEDKEEAACLEIVKAVAERNPLIITGHHFTYAGNKYDAVRGIEDVIALQKWMRTAAQAPQAPRTSDAQDEK